MLYHSLFHSNLLYCIGPLSTMSNSNSLKILKLQKKAIRSITNSKNKQASNPLFHNLNILPYNLLQKQAKLYFMHAVEYKYAPKTFHNVWQKNENRDINYPLRNNDQYYLPRINIESLKNLPLFTFPTVWNSLEDLRFQNNKITFQTNLKNNLISELIPLLPQPPTPPPPPPSPHPISP